MTNQNSLEIGQAVSGRSRVPDVPLTCGRTLHFGFFFDGFSRHLGEDLKENRVSNIGRLFLAHEQDDPNESSDEFNAYRKAYLSGLGADFDTTLGTQAGGTLNRAVSEVTEIPGDVAGDQALKAIRDGVVGRSWWQRKQREVSSLMDKPWRVLKTLRDTLINSAAEAFEPIRDSHWSASVLRTGVDTRLEGALSAFNREVTNLNSRTMPLRTINVSVFGFDFGAAGQSLRSHAHRAKPATGRLCDLPQCPSGVHFCRTVRCGRSHCSQRTPAGIFPADYKQG